jgi:hypothetical protein
MGQRLTVKAAEPSPYEVTHRACSGNQTAAIAEEQILNRMEVSDSGGIRSSLNPFERRPAEHFRLTSPARSK